MGDRVGSAFTITKGAKGPWLLLALLAALVAALPLLIGSGIVSTRAGGDSPFLLQRTHQLVRNVEGGVGPDAILPARWMPDSAYGLGYPAFNFYAALPFYLAALLSRAGFGILWGIKLAQLLGFILAGWATYRLARAWGASRDGALLASAAYTFAPFHLVNVYVRGDALSEFWAMALYPLLLWLATRLCARAAARPDNREEGQERVRERRAPARHVPAPIVALALAYAALILCHNISAMLFSPVLVAVLAIEALRRRGASRRRVLLSSASALILGLLLSAWFWLPALRESSLVQLQEQTTGYFHYAGHWRDVDLVQPRLLHDYRIEAGVDPFRMGAVQAFLAVVGLACAIVRAIKTRRVCLYAGMSAALIVASTWLMTSTSRFVWAHVPLLAMAQFPWRLLAIQALAVALLAAEIPRLMGNHAGVWSALALSVMVGTAGMGGLRPDRLPLREGDITVERLMFYETYSGNIGTTVRHEYLPREMVPRPYTSAVQWNDGEKPPPLVLAGSMERATLLHRTPEREVWEIAVDKDALLAFHTTFFPGWRAEVEGASGADIVPLDGLGLLGLRLGLGVHRVRLSFGPTRTRLFAQGLSILGILAVGVLLFGWVSGPQRRRVVLALAALALLGVWVWWAPIRAPRRQATGPIVADLDRSPYLHGEPDGVLWGPAHLLDYTLNRAKVAPGESLAVSLRWASAQPALRLELELVGATASLFEPAPVWAKAEARLDSVETILDLALPPRLAPGFYVLRPRLFLGDEELTPRTMSGQGMGRLILEPVQVFGVVAARGQEEALGSFGPEHMPPEISLVDIQTEVQQDAVQVYVLWRAERQATKNYWLSVRLKGADGSQQVARDLPPLLGGCPTTLWPIGGLIEDRVLLLLSDGESVEPGDLVEVVLYDRQTLRAVGTVTVAALF
jgi:hypothetical protein